MRCAACNAKPRAVSLILIDINHFKAVNDTHGHAVGDLILQSVATIAQSCIRSTDVLGRWGGEEFIVRLPASGFSAAADGAERIRRTIENSDYGDGLRITAVLALPLPINRQLG